MAEELQLALLGSVEVRRCGALITDYRTKKALALLCYLAVTGRPHLRPTLAGLLWGEIPEESARNNLSKALVNLRQLVGPYLSITRQTVSFNRDSRYWLDVEAFDAQVGNASATAEAATPGRTDIRRLEETVELYRGDFLEGFYVRGAPSFEEWALAQRAWMQELALKALRTLVVHHTQRGGAGLGTAIDYATRLLALAPWREEARRQLMLLLARNGQRGAALMQYHTCRRTLMAEFGAEPAEETKALYERIRQEGELPSPPCAPPHNLPAPVMPLIGRQDELAEIQDRLRDPSCRLLTLVGPGGSGKTRLALEAATGEVGLYTHGVFFVSLAPLQSVDGIAPTVAQELGFSLAMGAERGPQRQLLDYLRGKHMLVTLDNFEHLLEGTSLVTDILRAAPEVKIMVTSRARLSARGEHLVPVSGLQVPPPEAPGTLSQYGAVQLFLRGADRVHPSFEPTVGDLTQVARICQLVEGMPLAILLAVSWMTMLTPAEIAAQVSERSLEFLETEGQDVPVRQRSMRAVLDHSWDLLSEREQEVLAGLSVFRGGLPAAGRPAGDGGVDAGAEDAGQQVAPAAHTLGAV